jgi:hypothetical protein
MEVAAVPIMADRTDLKAAVTGTAAVFTAAAVRITRAAGRT